MTGPLTYSLRGFSVLVGALALATPVDARVPVVAVGEVTANDAATTAELRGMVAREIVRLDVEKTRLPGRYVFSAALVRLDATKAAVGVRAHSVVSGTLRRAGTGAIIAVTRGSASAEDDHGTAETVKSEALAAAVHGAVRRVSEAL